ncbi:MAG TPA: flagellar basal body L-ring protein FlgH [Candidatus Brocadiia bacterium]|nr:flagellar basal body L-ring protein FlgH [Candidatus Brocadiia bacterium]
MNRALILAAAFACLAAAARAESLFPLNDAKAVSLVADDKASRLGDVVTVIVQESQSVANSASLKLDKTASLTAKVDQAHIFSVDDLVKKNPVDLSASGTRSFNGEGEYAQSSAINNQVTCRVVQVLPNGDMVIEGSRVNDTGRDKQTTRVAGVVRPKDITSENTVLSTLLADAKIVVETEGAVNDTSKRGWFTRALDIIWPF